MKLSIKRWLAAVALLGASGGAWANAVPGDPAPAFRANDAAGNAHTLTDYIGDWVVLEWFNPDCGAVQDLYDEGQMTSLQKKYREEGIQWLTVISSRPGPENEVEEEEALDLGKERELSASAPFLLDETSVVARAYGVKKAPHIYIINPRGELVYSGAPGEDSDQADDATRYIERTLDAALANEDIEVTSTEPFGCDLNLDI